MLLRARRSADKLHIEVSDDGGGFRDGELLNRTEGIGLSNTKARLQALYGEEHQLRLTQNHPTGACVILEIPFREHQSKP